MADDDDTYHSITAVAWYFCLVEAEKREEIAEKDVFSWNVAAIWVNFTSWYWYCGIMECR